MNSVQTLALRQRRLVLGAIVVLASCTLFGAAELGLRVRQEIRFGKFLRIEDTYTLDPKSGMRIPVPGRSFGGIHINSMGFRGPELKMPKSRSTLRLAFLGSSTTPNIPHIYFDPKAERSFAKSTQLAAHNDCNSRSVMPRSVFPRSIQQSAAQIGYW